MSKLLVKWANFGYQTREIRTAIVFGTNGENVIIVLENDEVLAFGKNQKGCLGAGVDGEVNKELAPVKNLRGQRIEGFACAGDDDGKICIFAITGSGPVFSWGENGFGQLGLGTTEYTKVPTKILGSLKHKRVVQVACGNYHSLALTSEGEVYAFGRNKEGELGLGTNYDQSFPRKVDGLLDGTIVTSVACHNFSSLALLHSGEIFAWGDNSNGRIGLCHTVHQACSPSNVLNLEGVLISKIVSGRDFTLALSDDGKIYSWGVNKKGQLGTGTTDGVSIPTIISSEMGRVTEIAASLYESHPCVAITENHQVYIWGSCNGQLAKKPMLTSFLSLDEVFTVFYPPVSYQRFQLKITTDERKRKGLVNERLRKAFDNPETADFAFIVEGKKIHVHKNLLTIGSDLFKKLFLGDWKDSCPKEQIVEDHSYDAFYAFLKYFYTDEVDFTHELALDVYALAHFYQVTDLMDECEKILKSGMTVQNVAAVYEKAHLFGAKDLCEFCFKFCKGHLIDVVDNFGTADSKREVFFEVFSWAANKK
ncbi:RCC1 and BTB domain-containing protein 2-like [Cloeon dipterum]|uniref:RCC1 and BTB domain-containing protein 2-like n=1 Tax=Cloeon dipterum TaxID=197152 RepID=UPI00322079A9